MPCMGYEAITIYYLAFYKKNILGNKKIGVGAKIRFGRVIGNKHLFLLGLRTGL